MNPAQKNLPPKSLTREQCFEQLLLGRPVKSNGWLDKIREEAQTAARTLNFPSPRHDDWRFTDLSPLYLHSFHPVDTFARLTLADIGQYLIPGAIRLVFVDGSYAAELSDLNDAGAGVTVGSLAESFGESFKAGGGDSLLESHFGRYARYQQDAFVALNTNFFEDGSLVHVTAEAVKPIQLLHVASRRETPSAIYPRCIVVLEPLSRATIIEDFAGMDGGTYFTNAVAEVVVKDGAQLQHIRVQREQKDAFHIGHCSVVSGRNSVYASTSLAFGARVSRHSLHIVQQGEGAEMQLNGLALITGRQIADTHTRIDHAVPHGRSHQLHKCIADGSAHAVFSGKIIVHAGAVGTDSVQSSRNLLLSDRAHIDTQPQLEIFNDDVSCKHGATIGQIDADALFFLKSRGLTEERARNLLTHAFAAEIIDRIPVPELVGMLGRTILEGMDRVRP